MKDNKRFLYELKNISFISSTVDDFSFLTIFSHERKIGVETGSDGTEAAVTAHHAVFAIKNSSESIFFLRKRHQIFFFYPISLDLHCILFFHAAPHLIFVRLFF